jgi:hypothetical protein
MWYIIITERDKQSPQEKEITTMKFRVYNEKNIASNGYIFATYFKTKREAENYGKNILGGIYTIEKKIASNWVAC